MADAEGRGKGEGEEEEKGGEEQKKDILRSLAQSKHQLFLLLHRGCRRFGFFPENTPEARGGCFSHLRCILSDMV